MMKIQIVLPAFLTFILLFAACSNDNKSENNVPSVDSLKIQDSLAKSEKIKVEEKKAIANIRFGIPEKQFEQELAKFKNTLEHNEFETAFAIDQYIVSSFAGSFNNDSLYKVTALGDFIPTERYAEELLPQVQTLKGSIVKQHGEPESGNGAPESLKTQKGYSYKAYTWVIGSKKIDIKVANRGLYFSCDLIIYQPRVEETI